MRSRATFSAGLAAALLLVRCASAQEAESGFELRATVSAEALASPELTDPPRNGNAVTGGFRAMLYPVWKWSDHWSVDGAIQVASRPYFPEDAETQGYGVKGSVLQAHLTYSQFWKQASLAVRAGMLSSAFGSFLLRYDDAVNPLIGMPEAYGYYGGIDPRGLAGVQADATYRKLDFRAQLVSSSALNRRGVFDRDQYANWAGGAGYTIVQGLRVGGSFLRGPYLDRQYQFFFPGEAPPVTQPATGFGIDVAWARGHWNTYGEWQHFHLDYSAIRDFKRQAAYGEVRRVLSPRWFVAARVEYDGNSVGTSERIYEAAVGYRPNTFQLIKAGYQSDRTFAVQFISTFRALSFSR